jgi:hypothetical protein
MFDHLVKRSNAVWVYSTGRFAEERRTFLCDLNERGHSLYTLQKVNKFLLVIAERVTRLRLGEASRLTHADADFRNAALMIRSGNKVRQVATGFLRLSSILRGRLHLASPLFYVATHAKKPVSNEVFRGP